MSALPTVWQKVRGASRHSSGWRVGAPERGEAVRAGHRTAEKAAALVGASYVMFSWK